MVKEKKKLNRENMEPASNSGRAVAAPVKSDLSSRIDATLAFFDEMVELIPAKHYFPIDEDELESRYHHNKKKQGLRENSHKNKRQKLDPSQVKTVVEQQKIRAKLAKEKRETGDNEEDEDEDEDEEDDDEEDHDEEEQADENGFEAEDGKDLGDGKTPRLNGAADFSGAAGESPSIHQLREKLAARLASLRSQRGGKESEGINKRKKKEPVGRREKKNAKLKAARKDKPEKETPVKTAAVKKDANAAANAAAAQEEVKFNPLKFKAPAEGKKKKKMSEEKMLEKVTQQRDKINSTTDAGEKTRMLGDSAWKASLQRATGEVVRDDPRLLKKTIKKKESVLKKSKKTWKDRGTTVANLQKEQQDRRKQNLADRVNQKRDKKRGIKAPKVGAKKRQEKLTGHASAGKKSKKAGDADKKSAEKRPGFEGKKKQFLNK